MYIDDLLNNGVIMFGIEERENVLRELIGNGFIVICKGVTYNNEMVVYLYSSLKHRHATLFNTTCLYYLDTLCLKPNTLIKI